MSNPSENQLNDVETAPVVYPSMIMRACALVGEHGLFRSKMPSEHAAVLDRIIKIVDCNNVRKGIFARRATLAAMSSRSEHQVKRALAWLEANGVITRCKLAHAGNRGSTSHIYFTERALNMLQLSLPTPAELKPSILKRTVSENGDVQYSRTGLVKVGKVRLPADLAELVSQGGLKGPAVLKLMLLAKKAGQRLSDVLSAVRKYITGLTGGRLFAYLKAAATGKRSIAKELAEKAEVEQMNKERQAAEQAKRAAQIEQDRIAGEMNRAKGAVISGLSIARLGDLLINWIAKGKGREGANINDKLFRSSLRGMTEAELLGQGL